jgi:Zn finger protein HypA/HybF involved in hydrogenase expression
MKEDNKKIKAYEMFCTDCKHEWLSKAEDNYCPECKCVILEFQKIKVNAHIY